MEKDWRIENLEFLRGETLIWKAYRRPRPDWDHDHCAGCYATFIEPKDARPDASVLHEGYAVTDEYPMGAEYEWVCQSCFALFAKEMDFCDASPAATGEDANRPA